MTARLRGAADREAGEAERGAAAADRQAAAAEREAAAKDRADGAADREKAREVIGAFECRICSDILHDVNMCV